MSSQSTGQRIEQIKQRREQILAEQRRQREAQQAQEAEQQRQRSEQELNAQLEEQRRLEAEAERLNIEIAELERIQNLSPEQYREERIRQAEKSLNEKYNPQITQLEQERQTAVNEAIQTAVKSGQGPRGWKEAGRLAAAPFDIRIETLRRQQNQEYHMAIYAIEYPGRPLQGSVLRTFKAEGGQVSLVGLQEKRDEAAEAERLHNIASSQQTARSEAVRQREKLEFTKREFEQQKAANDLGMEQKKEELKNLKVANPKTGEEKTVTLTTATKREPGIFPSSFFEKMDENPLKADQPTKPETITGTTPEKSERAVKTFEQTEQEQKELYDKITGAKNPREATQIKTEYTKLNPFVGTPNIYLYKGTQIKDTGVLIDLKLKEKMPTAYEPIQNPKTGKASQLTEKEIITTVKTETKTETITTEDPAIIFLDEQGNEIKNPPIDLLWSFKKQVMERGDADPFPSLADQQIGLYEQENAEALDKAAGIDATGAKPLITTNKQNFQGGIFGHLNEISYIIGKEVNPKSNLAKSEPEPTLETVAFSDLVDTGKTLIFGGTPQNPRTQEVILEKMKTPDGQLWLAGTIAGTTIAGVASVIIPPVAVAKYGKTILRPATQKQAEKIAKEVFTPGPDKAFIAAQLREKYPKLSQNQARALAEKMARQQTKQDAEKIPYEVKMINDKTAIISGGTESTESKVIRYTRGGKSELYEGIDEAKPTTTKGIIVKGKQGKELTGGKTITTEKEARKLATQTTEQTKETVRVYDPKSRRFVTKKATKGTAETIPNEKTTIKEYPATKENIKIVDDPAASKSLANIGTKKTTSSKDLKKYPKQVTESLEKDKAATKIYETQKTKTKESFDKDVANLPKAGSIADKATKTKTIKTRVFNEEKAPDLPPTRTETPTPSGKTQQTTAKETQESFKQIATETANAEYAAEFRAMRFRDSPIKLSLASSKLATSQDLKLDTMQQPSQSEKLTQYQDAQTRTNLKQAQFEKQKELTNTRDIIKEKETTIQKDKAALMGRYDLIVSSGQSEKFILTPKTKQITKQRTITTQKIITLPDPTTDKPPARGFPGIAPLLPETEKKHQILSRAGRIRKMFFAWNVNEQIPGGYLPGPELRTGSTPRVIKEKEKVERKVNTKGYGEKIKAENLKQIAEEFRPERKAQPTRHRRQEKPFFKKSFNEFVGKPSRRFRIRF